MKKILALLLVAALALIGCAAQGTESTPSSESAQPLATVSIAALQGPTALSFVKMMDDAAEIGGVVPTYELLAAPDAMVAALAKGTYDIACLPLNTAATLFNNGTDYRLVGINTWGNMYIISTDSSIKTLADLSGKTVAVSQQGATPDVLLRYCLKQAGLTSDVTLDYTLSAHADLAAAVVSGQTEIALLPEPFVSNVMAKNADVSIVLDVQQLWADASGSEPYIPQGAVVVKGSFADAYPEAVREFIALQRSSAEFAVSDTATMAELAGKHGIVLPAASIISGTPRCNIVFKTTAEGRTEIDNYLNIILDFSSKDIGGQMPSESFFAAF